MALDRSGASDADALLQAVGERRDRDAFARLFSMYAPRVKRHLMTRGSSAGIADELTQEVMLTIWRKADLFDAVRGAAGTWIFAITRNCLLNHVRGRGYPVVEEDDPTLAMAPVDSDPEKAFATAQDQHAMSQALAELPLEQGEVLRGAYFRGRTLRELAEEKKVPLGTVKTRVRLALNHLRQLLKAREDQ